MTMTAELVRQLLHYDPETGIFRWRTSRTNRVRFGDLAGTVRADGRRVLNLDGRLLLASRVAFLYMTGRWPARHIDHADRDCSNDRWSNLREATRPQNGANSKHRRNASGFRGVRLIKRCNRWAAQIRSDHGPRHLGMFATAQEAARAYDAAARQRYGEFARLNFP